jgi:hypothetical protein
MATVYRKTDKGLAEIETRAHRLIPRLRTALIMVDGKRTDEELHKLIFGQAEETLGTLLQDGFIEAIATVTPRPAPKPTPGPTTVPPTSGPTGRTFQEVQRQAARFINDQLGPSAEGVVLKIEKSHDWNELLPHLEMAEHFLRAGRGADVSREFADKFIEPQKA